MSGTYVGPVPVAGGGGLPAEWGISADGAPNTYQVDMPQTSYLAVADTASQFAFAELYLISDDGSIGGKFISADLWAYDTSAAMTVDLGDTHGQVHVQDGTAFSEIETADMHVRARVDEAAGQASHTLKVDSDPNVLAELGIVRDTKQAYLSLIGADADNQVELQALAASTRLTLYVAGSPFFTTQGNGDGSHGFGMLDGANHAYFSARVDNAGVPYIGFFTPFTSGGGAVQQAHIADPAGGGVIDAEGRNAIIAILNLLEAYGLMAA